MKITITTEAKHQLLHVLGENPTIRINENRTTGWGATYEYELAQVEQIKNEEVFKVDQVTILLEPQVISHLDADIVVDYQKNYEFILKNSNEILHFGMKLLKKG